MASPDAKAYPHSQPVIKLSMLLHDLNSDINQYPNGEHLLT
jgi:hypothetical protein